MKKLAIPALLLFCFSFILLRVAAQNPTMNVEGTASSIVSKLDKSLMLTDQQKPRLLSIVTNYLQQKVNMQSLQSTNEKAYKTKLNSMQNGLLAKLKPLFNLTQYTEFMHLKPTSEDATNVLTQLYY